MKPLLLSICLLIAAISVKAQTTVAHPFPTDSAAWYEHRSTSEYYPAPYEECNVKYFYNGYQTVNNLIYSRVEATSLCYCYPQYFMNPCGYNGPAYNEGYFTQTLIRTDSNKIFVKYLNGYYNPLDTAEHVLYDYNLQVGDSFSILVNPILFQCVLIDSALTNTGYRKQWNLLAIEGCMWSQYDTLKWVEGVSSNHGLFYEYELALCTIADVVDQSETLCFMQRDTFVLGGGFASCEYLLNEIEEKVSQPIISIFPNPASSEFTVKADNPTTNLTITLYNLTGQQVGSYSGGGNQLSISRNNLPNGVYVAQIQVGTSVVRRKILFVD